MSLFSRESKCDTQELTYMFSSENMLSHIFGIKKCVPFCNKFSSQNTGKPTRLYKDNTEINLEGWKIVIRTFSVKSYQKTHILCLLYINFLLLRNVLCNTIQQKSYTFLPSRKRTIVREIYFLPRVFQRNFLFSINLLEAIGTHIYVLPYFCGRKHLLPSYIFLM